MDIGYYNSYLEIDLGVIRNSILSVRKYIEPRLGIIPVVKGNAYGMGLIEMAVFMHEFFSDIIACGQVFEAVKLRQEAKLSSEILVMSAVPRNAISKAIELDIQIPVFDIETAAEISRQALSQSKTAKVHIKIETGLNRIGVRPGQALSHLLDAIRSYGNIIVDGVYTHFASATIVESSYTYRQLELFKAAVEQIKLAGFTPRFIHCRNTGAASWLKENVSTHARIGTLLYGFPGMDDGSNLLNLPKEPESWRAFITNIATLAPGESCGYNNAYTASRATKVAIADIGYADGLFRPLAVNHGPVLVGDHRCTYLSTSMDQTFIDVTDTDCKIGDEITVFGYSKNGATLKLSELEKITGHTMTYLQTTLSQRVKRVFINGKD